MKKYLHLLKQAKLFENIAEDEIESMLQCLAAEQRSYEKGEAIFHSGERITALALLLEGAVHIQKEDYWGNLSILNEITEEKYSEKSMPALERKKCSITLWQ